MSGWTCRRCPGRPSTSTPPAASATRSRCRSPRWWRRAARPCRSCPAGASGHTGGTLDKLESIPGWRAALSNDEFIAQLREVGAVICAAGDGLAPADRKLYALRDVTGTVEAIPLIASSIMSKKIAEGTGALVLDVKVGSGRVHEVRRRRPRAGPHHGRARRRARGADGRPAHRHVHPARPGRSATRSRSTESVEVLAGGGPADVVELTLALAREMLDAAGLPDADPAAALRDGRAMDSWRAMIRAQGGDPDAPLPAAARGRGGPRRAGRRTSRPSTRTPSGWPRGGSAPVGPARRTRSASAAGVVLHRRPGDEVRAGDPLYELRADDATRIPAALPRPPTRCGSRRRRRRRRRWSSTASADRSGVALAWCRSPGALSSLARGTTGLSRASRQESAVTVAAPIPREVREASLDELPGSACRCRRPSFPLVWEPGDQVELRPTVRDRGARSRCCT